METPARITAVNFRTWRFGNRWLHWDNYKLNESGEAYQWQDTIYGGCSPEFSELFEQSDDIEDFLIKRQSRLPFNPRVSHVKKSTLVVFQSGVYWCPFTFQFWAERNKESEDIKALNELWHGAKWSDVLRVAESWSSTPSFKVRRHYGIAGTKDPFSWGLKGEYNAGCYFKLEKRMALRAFLSAVGRGEDGQREAKERFKKAVIRRVRKMAGKLTPGAIRFFQMFAGVGAINRVLKDTQTNTCN